MISFIHYIFFILLFLINNITSFSYDNFTINNTIHKFITKGEYSNLDIYLEDLKQKNISFIDYLTENINNKIKTLKQIS